MWSIMGRHTHLWKHYTQQQCSSFMSVCWSLMSARESNPFTALTRIRSQLLRTQWRPTSASGQDYASDRSAIGDGSWQERFGYYDITIFSRTIIQSIINEVYHVLINIVIEHIGGGGDILDGSECWDINATFHPLLAELIILNVECFIGVTMCCYALKSHM